MDKIVVTLGGIIGIIATYWFFLMKKDHIVSVSGTIDITVDGGYSPSTIAIQKDRTTTLTFTRRDASTCLEDVVLPDFKIKKFLPMNKPISISVTPTKPGTYEIVCGMNVFHGKIIVT